MSMSISSDLQLNMIRLSAAQRINSAADDAAGLAISEKMTSLVNGYDMATRNTEDMQSLVNTAEGGLSGINDSLQRIRELGIQSLNGTYSNEDRAYMQMEVEQLLDGIKDMAKGTQFNSMTLLDGSFADKNLASNPDGTGMKINLANSTLESLGIADFDLTSVDKDGKPNFDLSKIDNAIDKINLSRATTGAYSNRMEHTINYNTQASINQSASRSRISDLDMAEELIKLNTNKVLQQYQLFAQQQQKAQDYIGKPI